MDTNTKTTKLDIEAIKNKSYAATQNLNNAIEKANHENANYVMALNDEIFKLQNELKIANQTILTFRNQINDLQKRCKSYKTTIDGFSEVSIDKKIKAAYKDGYGAAMQKVLNLIKEIDEKDTNENSSQNTIDDYLSAGKGKFIFRIKDTKERKSDIVNVLSHVFIGVSPLQIDLWLQKNVMFVNGWTNLFVDISKELCSTIAKKIEDDRANYPFLVYGYFPRE